ncbi:MAG TPA: glycosyltransferase [Caulifigura sp.]|jgi:glycosyltransferase involved in cell wall biosynthesis|nr:glycosyltransferase [Caulifigura sp.]
MTLLQVCNVGRIVGGTAACAWSITRAFLDVTQHVAFLSSITDDTRAAFAGATLHQCGRISDALVRELGADAVILHNTAPERCDVIRSVWTLQYVHSRGRRAAADRTVYCSRWLAEQCHASPECVLYQPVPRPVAIDGRGRSGLLTVGRICTPTVAKWPTELVDIYADLAGCHPDVAWEFVGCPAALLKPLSNACRGRALFHAAGWQARSYLARWDVLLYHNPRLAESFGRTVAEAMRAGCVPVVDAAGGFVEQVLPGTGYLCRNRADFIAALGELKYPGLRASVSAAAVRSADERFSMAAFRKRLIALWEMGILGRVSAPFVSGQ